MGNPNHMRIAKSGMRSWNRWRSANLRVQPDLTRIDLSRKNLAGYDFRGVGLFKANLSGANLKGANLRQSILIKTNFQNADLTGAHIYGASVWDVNLEGAIQNDLIITEPNQPLITTDNLEVAQFLHLLLTNKKLRDVIDTITSSVVLILGRFTPERKRVLDRLKVLCREHKLLPVLFDFEGPRNRNITETVHTLAYLSKFIIADITSPRSSPQELQATVPNLKVPFVPLLSSGQKPWGMFPDLAEYPWVLPVQKYKNIGQLRGLFPALLSAVDARIAEISGRRSEMRRTLR
jgi:hypothetical protein